MPLLTNAVLRVGSSTVAKMYAGATLIWPTSDPETSNTPTFATISPTNAGTGGGTSVTIRGTNLDGVTAVTFGGAAATSVTVVNSTTITCTTPAHAAGPVILRITSPDGTAVANEGYYYGTPVIKVTSLTPTVGDNAGGTTVTITGANFINALNQPDRTSVTFEGLNAEITAISETSITCVTPSVASGIIDVAVIHTDGGGALPAGFTFTSSPTATPTFAQVGPSSGSTTGATLLTIRGTNLQSVTGVTIGGTAATSVTVLSSTHITCVAPAHTAGAATIVVTTAGGTATAASAYLYLTLTAVTHGSQITTSNTGYLAFHDQSLGRTLTLSDLTITAGSVRASDFVSAGGTISKRRFTGDFVFDIPDVTTRACLFDQAVGSYFGGTHYPGAVLDFCTVSPATAGDECMHFESWSANRSWFRGCSDGAHMEGGLRIQHLTECFLTTRMKTADDHNDGIQTSGGNGVANIRRCHISVNPEGGIITGGSGGPDAAILFGDFAPWTVFHGEVTDSYLDGTNSNYTLRLYDGALSTKVTYMATGNVFARGGGLGASGGEILLGPANLTPHAQVTWSGNTYSDNGATIALP